jgi:hypothetical protein
MGFMWILVAQSGSAVMRVVQRSDDSTPGPVLMFWGYCLNTLLWLPPGSIPPKVRLPFLWPAVPQDKYDVWSIPLASFGVMALSGVLGALLMVCQGQALKHLAVGTYSTLVTPLGLVFTMLYSAMKSSLGWLVWLGVSLQVVALMADMYVEKRASA